LRDNKLAAFVDLYIFCVTIFREPVVSFPGKLCFEAVGGVIEPGMQDTAVTTTGVEPA